MATTNTSIPAVSINDEQNLPFAIAPVDGNGKAQPIYGAPTWTVTKADGTAPASTLTPDANTTNTGYTAVLASGNVAEVVTVTVSVEADPTAGVNTLVQTCVVTITAAEDVTAGLTAGAPTAKA